MNNPGQFRLGKPNEVEKLKKYVLCIAMLSCLILGGFGWAEAADQDTLTIGNNSYVPINEYAIPGKNPALILNTVKHFENTHPQLEIISWSIDKEQRAYVTARFVYGIFIHHRPKK